MNESPFLHYAASHVYQDFKRTVTNIQLKKVLA